MSPTQVVSGSAGLKSRPTRSDAAVAARSTMVVRMRRRPVSPSKPQVRMIRATRLRPTRKPCLRSPGEFAGASLALTGVALLAATFVMFAKAEGNLLSSILGKAGKGSGESTADKGSINPSLHGYIPKGILAFTYGMLAIGLFGLVVLAPTRIYAAVQQFSIQGAGGMGTPEWVSAMLLGVQVQSLAVPISFIGVGGPIFATAFFFGHYLRHTNKTGFNNDSSTKTSFTQSSVGTIVIGVGAVAFLVLVWNGILGIMRLSPIVESVKAMLGGAQMTDPAFLGPFGAQMATFTQIMMTNLTVGMGVSSLLVAISIAAVISYMRLSTKHLHSALSGTPASSKSGDGPVVSPFSSVTL